MSDKTVFPESRSDSDSKSVSHPSSSDNGIVPSLQTSSENSSQDGYLGSTRDHAFADPSVAEYWRTKYEKAEYENRHRFDPDFHWSSHEEKKLVRKVDKRIMTWAWLMFFALDLNRRNVNRAITDTMLEDLGMDTNDFNYGQTIFLVSFLAAELPSGLVSKRLGADVWIPFIITAWSITGACQAFLSTKAAFFATRAILGLLMGGFIPDTVLYLTYFYKSNELPIRLSWFWTALMIVQIFGSLIAAGVLQIGGVAGWAGWQWLFMIEGLITLVIDGWFSEHEEKILVNRLLRDDPSKGDMNNREGVGPRLLWKTLKDWEQWPLYLIGLMNYIPPSPPTTYLSYVLRQLGFSTFEANLLVMPSQVLFAAQLLLVTWVSRKYNERSIVSSTSNIWIFPWLVALIAMPADSSPWARYAVLTGLVGYPYCHAILVAWNAKNSNALRTRAVSAALYNMTVQSGNIIASNIYREDDKPLYPRGNRVLLGICVWNVFLFYFVKAFYIWRNKVRDRKWNAMTKTEQEDYVLNTTDEGMKRLDFRFAH